jgi:hypothetical protein
MYCFCDATPCSNLGSDNFYIMAMAPYPVQVLRLGVFELTHMSLASHAVSDYVDLARQVSGL